MSVWESIKRHLPRIAARVEAEAKAAAPSLEEQLRARLREQFHLTDETIDRMGGDIRAARLMMVMERAIELIRGRAGSIGDCVDGAARVEGVVLSPSERRLVTLSAVRVALALDDAARPS